jgi:hypothetical protein
MAPEGQRNHGEGHSLVETYERAHRRLERRRRLSLALEGRALSRMESLEDEALRLCISIGTLNLPPELRRLIIIE